MESQGAEPEGQKCQGPKPDMKDWYWFSGWPQSAEISAFTMFHSSIRILELVARKQKQPQITVLFFDNPWKTHGFRNRSMNMLYFSPSGPFEFG